MAKRILVINGPNPPLLDHREPTIYGSTTLSDLSEVLRNFCIVQTSDTYISFFQSNSEGALLDRIHSCRYPAAVRGASYEPDSDKDTTTAAVLPVDAIVVNAGVLTHTSVSLRDALAAVAVPFVEVHANNVHAREPFRRESYLSDKAVAVICGLGAYGYQAAVEFCIKDLNV